MAYLHYLSQGSVMISVVVLYPEIRMLPEMPNIVGRSLNILSFFAGTCPLLAPLQMIVWWICTAKFTCKYG